MNPIDALRGVVSPSLLQRAAELSALLRTLQIPHALIGGLAVGVHGYPRTTKDIDFLVGEAAFLSTNPLVVYREELKQLARVGETDLMSVPSLYPHLAEELGLDDGIPVISLRGLVLMKLDAYRRRDQEDVRMLLAQSASMIRSIRDYLQEKAPLLVSRLAEVLATPR